MTAILPTTDRSAARRVAAHRWAARWGVCVTEEALLELADALAAAEKHATARQR